MKVFFCLFVWPCLPHVQVPKPGMEPAPQLSSETQQGQCWILNPLATKELQKVIFDIGHNITFVI